MGNITPVIAHVALIRSIDFINATLYNAGMEKVSHDAIRPEKNYNPPIEKNPVLVALGVQSVQRVGDFVSLDVKGISEKVSLPTFVLDMHRYFEMGWYPELVEGYRAGEDLTGQHIDHEKDLTVKVVYNKNGWVGYQSLSGKKYIMLRSLFEQIYTPI